MVRYISYDSLAYPNSETVNCLLLIYTQKMPHKYAWQRTHLAQNLTVSRRVSNHLELSLAMITFLNYKKGM